MKFSYSIGAITSWSSLSTLTPTNTMDATTTVYEHKPIMYHHDNNVS
jgi:hypothetical protein